MAGCVRRPGSPALAKDYVVTVRGLIAAEDLGFTLPHEHVFVTRADLPSQDMTDPEVAVRELSLYSAAGGRSLVVLSPIGKSRNPAALRSISERTGLNIVMATGFFKDKFMPPGTHDRSVEDMAALFVREIEEGVDGTGIRAGIIGEIGLSSDRQETKTGRTATEERVLRAAAHAQRMTGAGINLHFDIGGDLAERESALDILADAGADLKRVALSHFQPNREQIPHFHRIAERGCFVEFDLFGLVKVIKRLLPEDEVMFGVIRRLVAEGLSSHLLLSQDVCFKACLVENGGFGYAHIQRNILPKLKSLGVDDKAIHTMTVENPRRLLAIQRTY
ncbi:MAG: hypothetical protein L0Z50_43430 [Verrucomicrobiales bacterium]|nr:hypothetical protein [Verrucomicrobiales bacterium]